MIFGWEKILGKSVKENSRNMHYVSTIYNMSGRVVSDIQTRAEGESLYIRYNTDANVVNDSKKRLIL